MRKALLAVGIAAALVVLAPAASAGATTFDGSCKLKATVHFTPSINALPQQVRYRLTNGGKADSFSVEGQSGIGLWNASSCIGTLNGRPYDGPVRISMTGGGIQACDEGLLGGNGKLSFVGRKRHPVLGFAMQAPYVLRFPLFSITGNRGGNAFGTTQFWTTKNPGGFTNCVANGQLTPTTFATTPADGVKDAMFQAYIQGAPGGISG
jgi:hypothetical protein